MVTKQKLQAIVKVEETKKKQPRRPKKVGYSVKNFKFRAYSPSKVEMVIAELFGKHNLTNQYRALDIERRKRFDARMLEIEPSLKVPHRKWVAAIRAHAKAKQAVDDAKAKVRKAIPATAEQIAAIKAAKKKAEQLGEEYHLARESVIAKHTKLWGRLYDNKYKRRKAKALEEYNLRTGKIATSLPPQLIKVIKREMLLPFVGDTRAAGEPEFYVGAMEANAEKTCYSGSGGQAAESVKDMRKGKPPKFKRWTGEGFVSIQIPATHQCTFRETLEGENSNLKIVFKRPDVLLSDPGRKLGGVNAEAEVQMKLGRDKESWITFKAQFHRLLPMDSKICWVHLHRKRVGRKIEWNLRFSVNIPQKPAPEPETDLTVNVHLGFRKVSGGARAALWMDDSYEDTLPMCLDSKDRYNEAGDFGQPANRRGDPRRKGRDELREGKLYDDLGPVGELVFSDQFITALKSIDGIESKRDLRFNAERDWLGEYLKKNKSKLPDWLIDETKHFYLWRSQRKLAGLLTKLKDEKNQFKGNRALITHLHEWCEWDATLWTRVARISAKCMAHRKDTYKRFARRLANKYLYCIMPNVNWAKVSRRPGVLDDFEPKAVRRFGKFLAPGKLMEYLTEAFGEHRIKLVPAAGITMICATCGHRQQLSHKLIHCCTSCGEQYDIDVNALKNQSESADDDDNASGDGE